MVQWWYGWFENWISAYINLNSIWWCALVTSFVLIPFLKYCALGQNVCIFSMMDDVERRVQSPWCIDLSFSENYGALVDYWSKCIETSVLKWWTLCVECSEWCAENTKVMMCIVWGPALTLHMLYVEAWPWYVNKSPCYFHNFLKGHMGCFFNGVSLVHYI